MTCISVTRADGIESAWMIADVPWMCHRSDANSGGEERERLAAAAADDVVVTGVREFSYTAVRTASPSTAGYSPKTIDNRQRLLHR